MAPIYGEEDGTASQVDASLVGYDPQRLSLFGKVKALFAMGRLSLASEVPFWTILGTVLAWRTFPSTGESFCIVPAIECVLVTWGTNVSINFANEYWDYNLDRPEQVSSIKREVEKRRATEEDRLKSLPFEKRRATEEDRLKSHQPSYGSLTPPSEKLDYQEPIKAKIWHNSSRCIHDGTFPPYVALIISLAIQALTLVLIIISRHFDKTLNPSSTFSHLSPFKGFPLFIVFFAMFLSQEYVGPPLRLHYNGYGEFISCFFLTIVAITWGMAGCYTAANPLHLISPFDLFRAPTTVGFGIDTTPSDLFRAPTTVGFGIDTTTWILIAAMFFTEQARLMIMHIHDIDGDRLGGKITLVVRMGFVWSARVYVFMNVIAAGFWGWLLARLIQGRGAMLGEGGIMLGSRSVGIGRIWAVGELVILAYTIPIVVITSFSLFYQTPHRVYTTPPSFGIIPIISIRELAKLVSLQVITTPIVMSLAAILAGRSA